MHSVPKITVTGDKHLVSYGATSVGLDTSFVPCPYSGGETNCTVPTWTDLMRGGNNTMLPVAQTAIWLSCLQTTDPDDFAVGLCIRAPYPSGDKMTSVLAGVWDRLGKSADRVLPLDWQNPSHPAPNTSIETYSHKPFLILDPMASLWFTANTPDSPNPCLEGLDIYEQRIRIFTTAALISAVLTERREGSSTVSKISIDLKPIEPRRYNTIRPPSRSKGQIWPAAKHYGRSLLQYVLPDNPTRHR